MYTLSLSEKELNMIITSLAMNKEGKENHTDLMLQIDIKILEQLKEQAIIDRDVVWEYRIDKTLKERKNELKERR